MVSKRIKRYIIAPILILIIIVCLIIIINEINNGEFLVKYKTITYSSGCKEVYLMNGTNITPLCEVDNMIISILNYSGNYTEPNKQIKIYIINLSEHSSELMKQ